MSLFGKSQAVKDNYKRAFSFGKREHRLERWTNSALFVTVILFIVVWYLQSWFLFYFAFSWLLISLGIHLIARWCHRRERNYYSKANEKKGFWH
jgi:hypothetical protein